MGQIGFADIQPVGSMLTGGQLEDVSYESRHTQTKDVDACEKTIINIGSMENRCPAGRLNGSITYEANRPANVGVEITTGSVDIGLSLCS